jgi:hypothetical protein
VRGRRGALKVADNRLAVGAGGEVIERRGVDIHGQRRNAAVAEQELTNVDVPTAEVVADAVLAIVDRAAVGAVVRSISQRRVAAGDAGTVALVVAVVERALGVQISERNVLLTDEQRFAQAVADPLEADLRLADYFDSTLSVAKSRANMPIE